MHFEDRKYIESVKGVLILLVVLGHTVLASEYSGVKTFVYSFHVYAFLLIPFILPRKTATRESLLNAATRYLVPYLVVVFLASIPYGFMQGYSLRQWLWFYVRGTATGNSDYLKETSGLFLFWFLPVLLWVNVFLQVFHRVGNVARIVLVILFSIAHLLLPAMAPGQRHYYPYLGTHIALYVMPVGLLLGWVCRGMDLALCRKIRFVWLVGFALLASAMFAQGSALGLGHLGCPSYKAPLGVATHGLLAILAMLTLVGFSRDLARVPYLTFVGGKSLAIYLFSQPVVVATTALYGRCFGLGEPTDILLCGGLSIILGVSVGCAASHVIEKFPTIRALFFPRSYRELSSILPGSVRQVPRSLQVKS